MLPKVARLKSGAVRRGRWSLALFAVVLLTLPTWHGAAQSPPVDEKSSAKAGLNAKASKGASDSVLRTKAVPEVAANPVQGVNAAPLTAPPMVEFQPQPSEVEQRNLDKLNQLVTLDVKKQELQSLLAQLADRNSLSMLVDEDKLEEESLTTAAEVKAIKFTKVPLRSVLKIVLAREKLGYYVEDEMVKITTLTELEHGKRWTRTYPVGDLVCDNDDLVVLTNAIKEIVTPNVWSVGDPGGARITSVPSVGTLVVRHNLAGHEQVLDLVRALRKTRAGSGVIMGLSRPSGMLNTMGSSGGFGSGAGGMGGGMGGMQGGGGFF